MLSEDALQRKIDALPEPVLDYLYSERAGELNLRIIERQHLSEAQEEKFFGVLRELFVKELPLENLIPELRARLGFEDVRAKALAADIAGYRLLPLDKWLGDIGAYLRANGADPKSYPEFRVTIAHRTIDQAAKEVADSVATESEPHLQGRLQNIVESFLAGVRTESQTIDVLTRPEKIGGTGLDPKSAAHVLEEIHEETRAVVLDHEAPAVEKKAELAPVLSAAEGQSSKTKDDALGITTEDALEVAQFKKAPALKDIETATQEIYLASGLKTDDEAMAKRIKTIIGNRMRDVRDQMETLEILTQPKELGGLSMGQDAARALLNAIQNKLRVSEDAQTAKIQTEKTKWVEKEQRQKALSEAQTGLDQKADLERLFQSIVTKSKKASAKSGVSDAPVARATPAEVKAAAAPAPVNLPIAAASPVPPEFRTPAAPPSPPAAELPRTPTVPPVTLVKPTAKPPAPAAAPPAPATFAQRPKLEDVKASPKLTGPVEELRAITIVDFRRLSKEPKEACMKVKDKIDLLADQSYARRQEGIAAWTASEVVRTYLELMQDSLNGKPLPDAIAVREAQKKPVLTQDEFRAVSELSRQLRY